MKKKTVKWAVFLAILLALVLFCKWYTRPLPFRYFFPYTEQVVYLDAYWDDGRAQIPSDDPRFEPLMELLEGTQYRRSLFLGSLSSGNSMSTSVISLPRSPQPM